MEFAQSAVDILICVVEYAVGLIRWDLIDLLNECLDIFWVASLPLHQFEPAALNQELPSIPPEWIGWANWLLFPVGFIAQLYGYVLGAFSVYRVLRWISNRIKGPIQPSLF